MKCMKTYSFFVCIASMSISSILARTKEAEPEQEQTYAIVVAYGPQSDEAGAKPAQYNAEVSLAITDYATRGGLERAIMGQLRPKYKTPTRLKLYHVINEDGRMRPGMRVIGIDDLTKGLNNNTIGAYDDTALAFYKKMMPEKYQGRSARMKPFASSAQQ